MAFSSCEVKRQREIIAEKISSLVVTEARLLKRYNDRMGVVDDEKNQITVKIQNSTVEAEIEGLRIEYDSLFDECCSLEKLKSDAMSKLGNKRQQLDKELAKYKE